MLLSATMQGQRTNFLAREQLVVDRNSVGAVATLADPQNGKVFHLGFNPARLPEPKQFGREEKPTCRVLGRGVCFTRFVISSSDAPGTKIMLCPGGSWTTPQNIVGVSSWKNWSTFYQERSPVIQKSRNGLSIGRSNSSSTKPLCSA